jgi:oryzin
MQFFTRFLALAAAAVPFVAQAAPVPGAADAATIPGKWIIQLKPEADIALVSSTVQDIHARNIARRGVSEEEQRGIEQEYVLGEFKGYSGSFDAATVEEMRILPEVGHIRVERRRNILQLQVLHVEADFMMTTLDVVTRKQFSSPKYIRH